MTEFRAPPPPPALDMDDDSVVDQETEVASRSALDPKMIAVAVVLVIIGVIIGAIAFGGGSAPAQQSDRPSRGLTNVVPNPSITEPLKMCGQTTSESAPCILYIMNHSRYDKIAQDFFADAAKLSQRNNYTVEIENAAYAKTKIPPAFFVQMKIPALR